MTMLTSARSIWQQHRPQCKDGDVDPRKPNAQHDPRIQAGIYELDLVYVLHLVSEGSHAMSLLEAYVGAIRRDNPQILN